MYLIKLAKHVLFSTFLLATIISPKKILGQIVCQIDKETFSSPMVNEFWNFSLINMTNNNVKVKLMIELKQKAIPVFQSTSFCLLFQGNNKISKLCLSDITYAFYNNKFNLKSENCTLSSAGEYELCINVSDCYSDQVFTASCFEINITSERKIKNTSESKLINYKGICQLDYQYTQYPFFTNHNSLYQAFLSSTITFSDIPIGLSFNTNTSPSYNWRTFYNNIKIDFNKENLINVLKSKATDKISANNNAVDSLQQKFKNYNLELSKVNRIIENPTTQNDLKRLNELKNIDALLLDTLVSKNQKNVDSLNDLKKKYKDIIAKKTGLEKLLDKKSNLENKISGFSDTYNDVKKIDFGNLSNTKNLKNALKAFGLWRKIDNVISWVDKLGIGYDVLNYSDFTMNGIQSSGIHLQLCPYGIYIAASYGSISKYSLNNALDIIDIKKNNYALGLGYGSKNKNYFHLYYINSKNSADQNFCANNPAKNSVFSAVTAFNLLNNQLKFSGEFAISYSKIFESYNPDNALLFDTSMIFNRNDDDKILAFLKDNIRTDHNTLIDYAYKITLTTSLNKNTTEIFASKSHVGNNFISYGVNFLIKGNDSWEIKLSQKLLSNKIVIKAFYKSYKNNSSIFSNPKFNTYGVELKLNFKKAPQLSLKYMPWTQNFNDNFLLINVLNCNAVYRYKKGKSNFISSLSYIFQSNNKNQITSPYTFHSAFFNQSVIPYSAFSYSFSFSYSNLISSLGNHSKISFGNSFNALFFDKFNIIASIYLNYSDIVSCDVFAQLSFSVIKNLILTIKADKYSNRYYQNYTDNNELYLPTKDIKCSASLNYKW